VKKYFFCSANCAFRKCDVDTLLNNTKALKFSMSNNLFNIKTTYFHNSSETDSRLFMLFFLLMIFVFGIRSVVAQPPAGYYDPANGLTGQSLKTALHNIIKNHTIRSYDQLWTDFQSTDIKGNGKVWDMYSNTNYTFITNQCGEYTNEGDCFNREHSFPASWFGGEVSPMYTDLFHVFPTDGYVNNIHGNLPFAVVGTANYTSTNGSKRGNCVTTGYSGTVFEPADEYKGDFARTLLYMATRYENLIANWYLNDPHADVVLMNNNFPVYESWYLNMLGVWHLADPVSAKEIARNNAVYALQNNRNPFIDHPEFVYSIWGVGGSLADEPVNHATAFSGHTITLTWSDAIGVSLPDAYLVRMSATGFGDIALPADGVAVGDDANNKNIAYGTQKAVFGNLTPGQVYYFKIFPYRNNGGAIDYKTDGAVQQISLIAR
jgi:endonuclease I